MATLYFADVSNLVEKREEETKDEMPQKKKIRVQKTVDQPGVGPNVLHQQHVTHLTE